MIELLTAIGNQFSASPALMAIFPNGVSMDIGKTNGTLPNCCIQIIPSRPPEYNTGATNLNITTIQFDVWTTTDVSQGDGLAWTAIKQIKKAFDFANLTMPHVQSVLCKRTNQGILREDVDTWHAFVVYEIWTGETNGE